MSTTPTIMSFPLFPSLLPFLARQCRLSHAREPSGLGILHTLGHRDGLFFWAIFHSRKTGACSIRVCYRVTWPIDSAFQPTGPTCFIRGRRCYEKADWQIPAGLYAALAPFSRCSSIIYALDAVRLCFTRALFKIPRFFAASSS